MAKSVGYKPSTPNTNKGLKTHGSFKNAGQKSGRKGAVVEKPAREKVTEPHNVRTKLRMLTSRMFPATPTNRQARHQGKL
jgi:hypothetical protein